MSDLLPLPFVIRQAERADRLDIGDLELICNLCLELNICLTGQHSPRYQSVALAYCC